MNRIQAFRAAGPAAGTMLVLIGVCLGGSVRADETAPLRELTVETARGLVGKSQPLDLDGVTSLAADVAAVLAAHPGTLRLNGLRSLPDDVAVAFAARNGELHLDGVTAVSPAAAAALGRHRGRLLLRGLQTLAPADEAELARHDGPLWIRDLTTVTTPRIAQDILVRTDGALDHVTLLSVEAARVLARHQGVVSLNGLPEVSADVATVLSGYDGPLQLNGVVSLGAMQAAAFARHRGVSLCLDGLRRLAPDVARGLAACRSTG